MPSHPTTTITPPPHPTGISGTHNEMPTVEAYHHQPPHMPSHPTTTITAAAAPYRYNRFARHPYSGVLGINSGVMLMHLPRIRASNWLEEIKNHYQVYRYNITWGDQDLLNIYFHFHPGWVTSLLPIPISISIPLPIHISNSPILPLLISISIPIPLPIPIPNLPPAHLISDQLYTFDCALNYRPDHCMYGQSCSSADHSGVAVMHGNRRAFHDGKYAVFKVIYDAFLEVIAVTEIV